METINRYYLTGEVRMAQAGEFFRGNYDGDHGTVWLGPSKEPVRMLIKVDEPIKEGGNAVEYWKKKGIASFERGNPKYDNPYLTPAEQEKIRKGEYVSMGDTDDSPYMAAYYWMEGWESAERDKPKMKNIDKESLKIAE